MSPAPPLDAVPLDELVRELGPMPGPLAAEFGRQAADALRAAHEWGRAHGDVRPGTLFVGPIRTKLYPDGASRRKPVPGAAVVLADAASADGSAPADDLQGLGATLYYLLAGRPPGLQPAPLAAVRPDLPPGFADLVESLSAGRSGTAAEVADALAGFAAPVGSTPPPDAGPGWAADPFPSAPGSPGRPAPVRRPRTAAEKTRIGVLIAVGLVLNLAAVGLAVAWWSGALDRTPETPPADAAPQNAAPATPAKKTPRGAYRYVRYLAPDESWGNIAEFEVHGPRAAGKLAGKVIGTEGSWDDGGNTREMAFDGDPGTYFDAPGEAASRAWVGLDLGSAQVIAQIKYAPRAAHAHRMVGGRFQASNAADFSFGVVELYRITAAPPEGVLTARAVGPNAAKTRNAEPDPDPDEVRD